MLSMAIAPDFGKEQKCEKYGKIRGNSLFTSASVESPSPNSKASFPLILLHPRNSSNRQKHEVVNSLSSAQWVSQLIKVRLHVILLPRLIERLHQTFHHSATNNKAITEFHAIRWFLMIVIFSQNVIGLLDITGRLCTEKYTMVTRDFFFDASKPIFMNILQRIVSSKQVSK